MDSSSEQPGGAEVTELEGDGSPKNQASPRLPWIVRMQEQGAGFSPVYLDEYGQEVLGRLSSLRKPVPGDRSSMHLRLQIDLRELKPMPLRAYAKYLGPPVEGAATGETVFGYELEGTLILIPASLLIPGICGPLSSVGRYLVLPTGLDLLGCPTRRRKKWWFSIADAVNLDNEAKVPSIRERLLWLSTFPSAAEAWRSVYAAATRGVLSMKLPSARAAIVLRCTRSGASRLTVGCTVMQVTPLEQPFPFASSLAGRTFVLHAGKGLSDKFETVSDDLVPKGSHGWALSDDEWELMSTVSLLRRTFLRRRAPLTRKLLSAVLEKYGRGCGWSEVTSLEITESSCRNLKRRLEAEGRWGILLGALAVTRAERQRDVNEKLSPAKAVRRRRPAGKPLRRALSAPPK